MKTLKAYKNTLKRLERQIELARVISDKCQSYYIENPTFPALIAFRKAFDNLYVLYQKMEATMEMIANYQFYARCWEEEQSLSALSNFYQHN